ncbi:MAG: MFS transporter [Bacteroidales bacterium]|nr:MFS transporter [Bacteroidales bacterium]MDD4829290.1 MFS transporter [Bacteroidales bacterium]
MKNLKLNLFESLSCRNFRLYFFGQCISLTGSWIQQVAMGWLIYRLTDSVSLLGIIVFLSQAPTFIITPLFSSIIDRVSKQKILVLTQTFFMLHALSLTLLLFFNILSSENVWIILFLSLLFGIVNALDQPTRQAFYTSLVPKEMLTNSIALNSAIINGSRLIGPAIGGFLIVYIGEMGCFLIDTISYIFVILSLLKIKLPIIKISIKKLKLLMDTKEGIFFIKQNPSIKVLLSISFFISFFILPITTFFPAYIKDGLSGGSQMLGTLMSFLGIGSFSGALLLASRTKIGGLDIIQRIGILTASIIIIPFFYVTSPILSHFLSLILGLSMVIAIASTNTLIQSLTPIEMKGRIMGYYTICFIGGSSLGNLILGYFAGLYSLQTIMAISGIISLLVLFFLNPYIKRIKSNIKENENKTGIIPEIVEGISQSELER